MPGIIRGRLLERRVLGKLTVYLHALYDADHAGDRLLGFGVKVIGQPFTTINLPDVVTVEEAVDLFRAVGKIIEAAQAAGEEH